MINCVRFITLYLLSFALLAQENPSAPTQTSFSVGLGHLSGESREVVYDADAGGRKVSELFWNIDTALTVVGGFHTVNDTFKFDLNGWLPLSSDNQMDDYDWLYQGADWTHWSSHPDTRMRNTYAIDAMLSYILKKSSAESLFGIDLIAGYRILNLEWIAYGGSYVYSDTQSGGFRDQIGNFDASEKGISYRQTFSTPYLGIGLLYPNEKWIFSGKFLGSQWATGDDFDTHHARDTTFESTHDNMTMTEYGLKVKYLYSEIRSLFLDVSHQKYKENSKHANTKIVAEGRTVNSPNSAGLDHKSTHIMAGIQVNF